MLVGKIYSGVVVFIKDTSHKCVIAGNSKGGIILNDYESGEQLPDRYKRSELRLMTFAEL